VRQSLDDRTGPAPAGGPAVTLSATVTPVVSYALAHNAIAVVHRVEIDNTGPAIAAATLRIGLQDADGPLGAASDHLVDLPTGGTNALTRPQLFLDPAAMARVTVERAGEVRLSILVDDSVVAEHVEPVRILAANQWVATPTLLGLEMLAAFVLPHHPAVSALLGESTAILQQRTGSPALPGYRSGPGRVDEVARSIFEAAQARRVRYVTPPASWTGDGQVVRDPAEVLDGRLGTSLDTTLLMAAALELAGLRPLLFVVSGHAFLGYWRDEQALPGPAQTDIADLVNLIDLDLIRLVETTTITVSDPPWTFQSSHRPPYTAFLAGDLNAVLGVVDVRQSRLDRIEPLPARVSADDGSVQVITYVPAGRTRPAPASADGHQQAGGVSADIPPRIEQWKNALLDLSLRNTLINFHRRGSIGLAVPDGLLGAVEDRVHEPPGVLLLGSDQVSTVAIERGIGFGRDLPEDQRAEMFTARAEIFTDVPVASYDTRLRAMAHKARTIVEETGANNLYLALGSLLWRHEDRELRSPLVLVPIRLSTKARSRAYRIELDDSGASTPNFCLLEKLRQVHGLQVPGLAQPTEDAFGIDLDAALQAMRVALAQSGLPYRVEPTADIAVLQFAKYRLWKDLSDHWPALISNPLVNHLVHAPFDPFVDPATGPPVADLDELAAACPIPADASQTAAVGEATAGRTFVLEGPPGTGKSQTITNLLARAIADGRRVLFVAEKRAALDVVTRRLDAVGLGPFCLDLHDKSSKPTVVRAQIRAALDHRVVVDNEGLAAIGEDLRASRGQLARYASRLHEANDAGLSYYSARTALLSISHDAAVLPIPAALLTAPRAAVLADLRRGLTTLGDLAAPANPVPDHPWGFVDGPVADPVAVGTTAAAVDSALADLPTVGRLAQTLAAARSADDLAALLSLSTRAAVPVAVLDEARSARWQHATTTVMAATTAFAGASHAGLDLLTPQVLDLPLADLRARADAAAASSWFGRKKRLTAVGNDLSGVRRPGTSLEPAAIPALLASVEVLQKSARSLGAQAAAIPGVVLPPDWNPLTEQGGRQLADQIGWLRWAGAAVDPSATPDGFAPALRNWVAAGVPVTADEQQRLIRAQSAVAALVATCPTTNALVAAWAGEPGLVRRWTSTAPARALSDPAVTSLRRWSLFLQALEPLRVAGAEQARRLLMTGRVPADDAARALDAGLAAASTAERRDATGLATFDPIAHGRQITRFTTSAAGLRSLLTSAIPQEVLQRRTFDSASGLGQVGELQRELAKQRRGLSVRALLARYGDLITAVMPCMLVSPDSLARFFPPRQGQFDMVVFDEASQIRVADAVGAMGRGQSVVVVGDSKQMPPTSFAELSLTSDQDTGTWTSERGGEATFLEEDISALLPAQDEESILSECVQARVPQRWLSWHYRSQDESLIAFSNRQYYAGGLSSFPAPRSGAPDPGIAGHGINLVRVDGVFHRSGSGKLLRTNPVEAQAVVDEIHRRFAASPTAPSIGVVTFNVQQRALIESLLRDSGDERVIQALDGQSEGHGTGGGPAEHEGLFVKNLENVQGDERDVILFSTAFSVNDRGYLPLNFGPLNRAGGERRLNVAITRARRQVIVFSSFDPAQLRAEETSSVGIKHLRAYLDLAQQGPAALAPLQSAGRLHTVDRHREEIAEALRRRGFHVGTDVGLSEFTIDLVVAPGGRPDEPMLAVLLDGPGWAARRTVGDRDGLPVDVLSGLLRWPAVQRVWLPEWLADRDNVLDRLTAVIDEAVNSATPVAAADANAPVGEPPAGDGTVDGIPPAPDLMTSNDAPATPATLGESPFTAWVPDDLGDRSMLDGLPAAAPGAAVYRALIAGIEAEGPIHIDRLVKAVAAGFGLHRVVASRHQAIVTCLPQGVRKDPAAPEFCWPLALDPLYWRGFRRTADGVDRPLEHISPRELGNAMEALCGAAAGMTPEQLWAGTLAVFGFSRRGPAQVDKLTRALELLIADGRLTRRDDGILIRDVGGEPGP
jgi:hypothetical protein